MEKLAKNNMEKNDMDTNIWRIYYEGQIRI